MSNMAEDKSTGERFLQPNINLRGIALNHLQFHMRHHVTVIDYNAGVHAGGIPQNHTEVVISSRETMGLEGTSLVMTQLISHLDFTDKYQHQGSLRCPCLGTGPQPPPRL